MTRQLGLSTSELFLILSWLYKWLREYFTNADSHMFCHPPLRLNVPGDCLTIYQTTKYHLVTPFSLFIVTSPLFILKLLSNTNYPNYLFPSWNNLLLSFVRVRLPKSDCKEIRLLIQVRSKYVGYWSLESLSIILEILYRCGVGYSLFRTSNVSL